MVRRRRRRRKRFSCGHLGYGRWCHRCRKPTLKPSAHPPQPAVLAAKSKAARLQKAARQRAIRQHWEQQFLADPISLRHLPKPIVIKTRLVLAALANGTPPADLRGKRFPFDRTLLRIPISYRYRLLCRWKNGQILPLKVMSHEDYNAFARNKKRVSGE